MTKLEKFLQSKHADPVTIEIDGDLRIFLTQGLYQPSITIQDDTYDAPSITISQARALCAVLVEWGFGKP